MAMCLVAAQSQPLQIMVDTWREGGVAAFFGGNAVGAWGTAPECGRLPCCVHQLRQSAWHLQSSGVPPTGFCCWQRAPILSRGLYARPCSRCVSAAASGGPPLRGIPSLPEAVS